MYYNGQIVWDFDLKKPVKVEDKSGSTFAWEGIPKNSSCFVLKEGGIYLPTSIEDALEKLDSGYLRPFKDILVG